MVPPTAPAGAAGHPAGVARSLSTSAPRPAASWYAPVDSRRARRARRRAARAAAVTPASWFAAQRVTDAAPAVTGARSAEPATRRSFGLAAAPAGRGVAR